MATGSGTVEDSISKGDRAIHIISRLKRETLNNLSSGNYLRESACVQYDNYTSVPSVVEHRWDVEREDPADISRVPNIPNKNEAVFLTFTQSPIRLYLN